MASIQDIFNQPGLKMHCNLQELLLKAAKKERCDEEYDFLVNFFGNDFNSTLLKSQRYSQALLNLISRPQIFNI